MIVTITFPDGRKFRVEIPIEDLREMHGFEDLAEYIARKLVSTMEWIEDIEKAVESHKRWILAHLLSTTLEDIFRE